MLHPLSRSGARLANGTSSCDAGGAKCFHLRRQSVKGDNKRLTSLGSSWSCRTTSTADEEVAAAEEQEFFPRSSRRAALFLPHRLMVRVGEGGRLSISDHVWAFLRAHFTNGILSMPVPHPLPPRLIFGFFQRRNVNVSTTSLRCVRSLLWPQPIYNVAKPDGYD